MLVNCRRKVPASLKIRSVILDTDPVPVGISIKDVEAEQGDDSGGLRLKDDENAGAANRTQMVMEQRVVELGNPLAAMTDEYVIA